MELLYGNISNSLIWDGGNYMKNILDLHCHTIVSGHAYSTLEEIVEKVRYDLYYVDDPNFVVVLFHEMDLSVKSLPYVITELKNRGYIFKVYDPNNHIPINFNHNNLIKR